MKSKQKDILLQDLKDHTHEGPQSLQEYAIVVDMIALINTILNKSSTYSEFGELFVKRIPKDYRIVDITADCYKTKSIKSSEQLLRGQSEKIHIASQGAKRFHNRALKNFDKKNQFIELIFEYIKKEQNKTLSLGSSGITLSSESKCTLVTATERHELLHLSSSQEEADTRLILYAHEIFKKSSSKVSIHSPSGDTDILLLALAHLYEYKKSIYIIKSHGRHKKTD